MIKKYSLIRHRVLFYSYRTYGVLTDFYGPHLFGQFLPIWTLRLINNLIRRNRGFLIIIKMISINEKFLAASSASEIESYQTALNLENSSTE